MYKSRTITFLLLTLFLGSDSSLTMKRGFHSDRINVPANCTLPKACTVPEFPDWFRVGGYCAKYFKGPLNFTEAAFSCLKNNGSHLASVHNPKDNNDLLCIVNKLNSENLRTWIGGFRLLKSLTFFWIDGSMWNYEDWVPGEPNHINTNEECVEMNWKDHGKWNDDSCFAEKGYICAFKQNRMDIDSD